MSVEWTSLAKVALYFLALRCVATWALGKPRSCLAASLGPTLLLLLSTYGYWLFGSLWNIPSRALIYLISLTLSAFLVRKAVLNFSIVDPSPPASPKMRALGIDAIFWGTFILALFIRAHAPAIDFGEKYADLAIFQSVVHARAFPPMDLWLSGHSLNYYYFGQLIFSPLTFLLDISPEYAFNIATSAVFALSISTVFGIGVIWGKPFKVTMLMALSLMVFGNWEWIRYALFSNPSGVFWWWDSSRAIQNTITEFPYFSFLLGDFHAHYIALPWLNLFLALILFWEKSLSDKTHVAMVLLMALVIGAQYPLNAWNLPICAAFFAWRFKRHWIQVAKVGALSWALYLPYWLAYHPPKAAGKPILVDVVQRSDLLELVLHWAPFLVPISWIVFAKKHREGRSFSTLVDLLLSVCAGWAFGWGLAPIAFLTLRNLRVPSAQKDDTLSKELISLAFLLILFCEFVSLDKSYGGPYLRLNTVFKLYYVAWWAFAMAVPARMGSINALSVPVKSKRGFAWIVGMGMVLAFSFLYPLASTRQRTGNFRQKATLDGMRNWKAEFPGERDAVEWLRSHTDSTDVLWEAHGSGYREFARMSSFAGRPTVLGWLNHQWVWRGDGPHLTHARESDIQTLFAQPTEPKLRQFLAKYDVRWVIVGKMERNAWPKNLRQALTRLPKAFSNATVDVYAVSDAFKMGT